MPIRTERQGPVARIIIDAPPMNPINAATLTELLDALDGLAADPAVRVLTLTGAGDQAFCAGADIRGLAALESPEQAAAYAARWDELYRRVREFPCPTVAVVNGYALGGGFEILLNTDLRVAADSARLGCTAANLGLVTSIYSLATQLPMPLAKELFFTARHVTAAEAERWGLINRVVPAAGLATAAQELVEQILRTAPLAHRRAKPLFAAARTLERTDHDRLHGQAFVELAGTADHRLAVRAFLEKRRPDFEGQ